MRFCIAKLGEPFQMRQCGEPVVYLPASRAAADGRGPYSGWYHQNPDADDHGAVPDNL